MKMHVKKGDNVEVIRGASRGKTGVIAKAMPQTGRIIITGINMKKKHVKPTRTAKGKTIEIEHSISVSNVRLAGGKVATEKAPKVAKPKLPKKVVKKAE